MPRSSRLETHDHSTCGFMAWCRKSGAQVAGKLENSTAIVAADGEKSARIDLKVLPAFDKCPNEGKDERPWFAGWGKPPCTALVCGARDGGRGGQRGFPFSH